MKKILYFLLSVILLAPSLSFAQSQWFNFTTANGLPNNDIATGMMDRQGNIWFATFGGGAAKFNGSIWTKYNTSNSGIASNQVLSIAEDSSGNMWFGTYESGVSKFNGTTWTTYDSANGGLNRNMVPWITVDDTGNVWVTAVGIGYKTGGVNRFNGTSWTVYDTSNSGLADPSAYSIFIDHSGNVWIGTLLNGLSKFNGTTWTNYNTSNGLVNNRVYTITEDTSGNLWFGTYSGASKFNGTTWTNYTTADGLRDNLISQIVVDYVNNKWFATYGGVSKFNGTTWTSYTTANGLIYNDTRTVVIDRQGNVWFGTQYGVSRYGTALSLSATTVSVPKNTFGSAGDTIIIPVSVSGISQADSVLSYQFTLTYNDSIIHFIGFDTAGTGMGTFTILDTIQLTSGINDSLLISGAATSPADSGTFIKLKFRVNPSSQAGDSSGLIFKSFVLNEGSPGVYYMYGGSFQNTSQILYGDVNRNGIVNASDASLILRYTIGTLPLDNLGKKIADVSGNGTVFAYDAALILRRSVGFITTFPVGDYFTYPKSAQPALIPKGIMELAALQTSPSVIGYQVWLKQAADVVSGNFTIQYNPKALSFQKAQLSNWSKGFVLSTSDEKGMLNIALAGTDGLQGEGIFLTVYFNTQDESETGIKILEAVLNETSFNNITGVSAKPMVFDLSQNYPNPFNPTTFIQYQLPEASYVSLVIYNILGQRIKTLINSAQPIGYYNIVWDGTDNNGTHVASGIYFYRLQTESFIKTRKMMVLK